MELEQTSAQDWVRKRIAAVQEAYPTFDCLIEHGVELQDPVMDQQIPCPFPNTHGPDRRPSSRYYAGKSPSDGALVCFKENFREQSVALHARFNGLKFMEALQDLERRFRIRVPRRPEAPAFAEPADRTSHYESEQWTQVPRVLELLESQLYKLRTRIPMLEFVKYCRVLDAVAWDIEKSGGVQNASMVEALTRLRIMMNNAYDKID